MFNNLCIIISLAINVMMLVSWEAPASGADVDEDNPNETVIDMVKEWVLFSSSIKHNFVMEA